MTDYTKAGANCMSDNIIKLVSSQKVATELNEAETRAVARMMHTACICARKWIAVWAGKRPPRDESLNAMQMLVAAEMAVQDLAETPPHKRDLARVDGVISDLDAWRERLQAKILKKEPPADD
jgi:hypothetical protein